MEDGKQEQGNESIPSQSGGEDGDAKGKLAGDDDREGSPHTGKMGSGMAEGGAVPAGSKKEPPRPERGKDQGGEGAARDRAENLVKKNYGRAYAATYMEIHEASGTSEASAKVLSPGHFETWSPSRLQKEVGELESDEALISNLVATLMERRILILVGEPELGKAAIAMLMANQICRQAEASGMSLCQRLEGAVRIDFNELTGDESAYHDQLLIIKDAFAWHNADLQRFCAEMTLTTARSYADRLKEVDSYLVLTSDSSKLQETASLQNLGILQQMQRPAPDLLAKGFKHHAVHLMKVLGERAIPTDKVKKVEEFVNSNGPALAEKLGTFPRVARFVRDYLVSTAEEHLTEEQALERMDDLRRWLLSDLIEDFDAFCFALALVLCSGTRPEGIPWLRFERVRRVVETALRRELRRSTKDREVRELCLHEAVVAKARAEIVRSPFPEGDIIRFTDERYPVRLWQVLTGPGRNLLALLLPLLHSMLHERDLFQQEVAAQALGRIGQLDPTFVTTPLLYNWIHGEQADQAEILGQLLQGVMSSGDHSYRNGHLALLLQTAVGGNLKAARAAVVSLKGVGNIDLQAALAGLRHVLNDRVEIAWDVLNEAVSMLREFEESVSREELREAGWVVLSTGFASEEGAFILGAVQYTIAGLMFSLLDLTPVLEGLADWMVEDKENLAPLVVFLFLHERGLANLMRRYKLTIVRDWRAKPMRCDRIVYALGAGDEANKRVQTFLLRIFRSLSRFPGLFREILRAELFAKLKDWAQEACEVPVLRDAVVQLLAELRNSRDAELSAAIDRWLRGDHDFANRESELHKIAVDVLTWTREASPLPVAVSRS